MMSMTDLRAAIADRYRIERELGAGGMATVYLAHDLKHDRDVALKVLDGDLAQSLGRDRFLREIRFAAKLVHPHILPLFGAMSALYVGRLDDAIAYAMRSAELRDAIGPIWSRWPDIAPPQAHPRYPDVLSRMYT